MLVAIEPQCADAGRYNVTQACALLGIHRSTLERYRAQNLIVAGYRLHTGREIKKLWRIL